MSKPIVIVGNGGHALVVLDVLKIMARDVKGILTPGLTPGSVWHGLEVLGDDNWLVRDQAREYAYAIGVGLVPQRTGLRRKLFNIVAASGLEMPAVIHPGAIVAADVRIGAGVQVMAGAILQPGVEIGDDALINTRASIDHHCHIGAHSHIAPGATVCGDVHLEEQVFIGAGSVVTPGVRIGSRTQVAAGATVISDLPEGVRFIPGKSLKKLPEAGKNESGRDSHGSRVARRIVEVRG